MNKKLLTFLLVLLLTIGLLPQTVAPASAASWSDGGYDTSWYSGEEPYIIADAADLAGLAVLVNGGESFEGKSFELSEDIDLSGKSWVPIGTGDNAQKRFLGSFDGGGHTISGMQLDGYYLSAGLFGSFGTGRIENLTLDESCSVSCGGSNVGALVGSCDKGIIENCYSFATVNSSYDGGNASIGGLVGFLGEKSELNGCTCEGNVSAGGSSRKNVGGLVGFNKGQILRGISLGTVSATGSGGSNNAGGISGFENDGTTKNCYSRGAVSASGGAENYAGGIAGRFSTTFGMMQNCYSTGKISANGSNCSIGGVLGKKLVGTVYCCYYKKSGDLTGIGGEADWDGFVTVMSGEQMKAEPGDVYGAWSSVLAGSSRLGGAALVDALNKGIEESPDIWAQRSTENDGYPFFAANNWADAGDKRYSYADYSWLNDAANNGTEGHPYLISNGAQLAGLAALVNASAGTTLTGIDPKGGEAYSSASAQSFEGKFIRLNGDIDLSERLWTPIGNNQNAFMGCFDGDGYTISGMFIGSERVPEKLALSGLFGSSGGSITGVNLSADCAVFLDGTESSVLTVGAIAAKSTGLISGCRSLCTITVLEGRTLAAGGIVGESFGQSARVRRCSFAGKLTADLSAGGAGSAVGGIAGESGREAKQDNYEYEELDGEASRNAVFSCLNEGEISVTQRATGGRALVGGIVGRNSFIENVQFYPSGFGVANDGTIKTAEAEKPDFSASVLGCANLGKAALTLRADNALGAVGGIVGGNVLCYSQGDLEGFLERGGAKPAGDIGLGDGGLLLEVVDGTASLKSCYNAGKVVATLTRGTALYKGALAGLSTAEGDCFENCFYLEDGSIGGVGAVRSDAPGEIIKLGEYQMKAAADDAAQGAWAAISFKAGETGRAMPMVRALNDWTATNDKELGRFFAEGTGYPKIGISISYNAKGGENAPTDGRIYGKGESARVILGSKPSWAEHTFLGWAKTVNAAKPDFAVPDKDASDKEREQLYKAALLEDLQDNLTLYAVWEEKPVKSKDTANKTTQNDDGTATVVSTTTTTQTNGDVTIASTETTKDISGKVISTKTISSVYNSALGTTTEQVKIKGSDGKTVKTAGFTMEDADKVEKLPEELTRQLRAGALDSLIIKDKEYGTSTELGWNTDENGKKTSQSAAVTVNSQGTAKLSPAISAELAGSGYKLLELKSQGLSAMFPSAVLKALGNSPLLSIKQQDGRVSLTANGKGISLGRESARAELSYAPKDAQAIVVAECLLSDGSRKRTAAKLSDGKASFALADGVSDYELCELQFPFEDVKKTDWFYDAVAQVFSGELMTGVSETQFAPQLTASRAMVVTLLWRMAGEQKPTAAAAFTDVSEDAWYSNAVSWAAQEGIVKGVSDGSFAPDLQLTREQLVTILYRWRGFDGDIDELPTLSKYSDGGSVSDYALQALRWASVGGVITGRADGKLDPLGQCTRSELATVIVRLLGL